jgi:D-tyrosyl-tRNA(Tyr) deacylase
MIAVVQRVREAAVTVEAQAYRAAIGPGLCVLLAVARGDTADDARWMARRLAHLRIFADESGKMNRSVRETGGSVLLVSQFTLAGDTSRGNRPSFAGAAEPEEGRRLCDLVAQLIRQEHGVEVSSGVFGAMMVVSIINDGPVTVIVETRRAPRQEADD